MARIHQGCVMTAYNTNLTRYVKIPTLINSKYPNRLVNHPLNMPSVNSDRAWHAEASPIRSSVPPDGVKGPMSKGKMSKFVKIDYSCLNSTGHACATFRIFFSKFVPTLSTTVVQFGRFLETVCNFQQLWNIFDLETIFGMTMKNAFK